MNTTNPKAIILNVDELAELLALAERGLDVDLVDSDDNYTPAELAAIEAQADRDAELVEELGRRLRRTNRAGRRRVVALDATAVNDIEHSLIGRAAQASGPYRRRLVALSKEIRN